MAGGMLLVSAIYQFRVRQVAAHIDARFEERLAERARIEQELHDTLLQGFLSASMQVHIARDRLPEDSQVKPVLTRVLELMGQVIEEGRNAVRGLRLSPNASLDLEQAFAGFQRDIDPKNAGGKEAALRVLAEGRRRPLRPVLRDEVYSIGREALANAFRHARAHHVEVELKYGATRFQLLVRDDGCGIEPDVLRTGREGHWGLSGMRDRAERIGARIRIFSNVSAGTEVELTIPARVAFQDQPKSKPGWFRRHARQIVRGALPSRSGGSS
jgi:signal transduction histidine kinase